MVKHFEVLCVVKDAIPSCKQFVEAFLLSFNKLSLLRKISSNQSLRRPMTLNIPELLANIRVLSRTAYAVATPVHLELLTFLDINSLGLFLAALAR